MDIAEQFEMPHSKFKVLGDRTATIDEVFEEVQDEFISNANEDEVSC